MRKILLTLSCWIIVLTSFSQDYSCIKDDGYLYIRPDKHFEGIHIDSARMIKGDSMLFFHPLNSQKITRITEPWIGEKAKVQADRTIFYINNKDTIIIQTKPTLNNEWYFYKTLVKAKIEKLDTMTLFNGEQDSVIIIALIKNDPLVPDSINTKKIIVSKNHGLILSCKLSDFNGMSFSEYKKYQQKLPTKVDFYKYEIGDVIQREKSSCSKVIRVCEAEYITDTIIKIEKIENTIIYTSNSSSFSITETYYSTGTIESVTRKIYFQKQDTMYPTHIIYNIATNFSTDSTYYVPVYPLEKIKNYPDCEGYSLFLNQNNVLEFSFSCQSLDRYAKLLLIEGLGTVSSGQSTGTWNEGGSYWESLVAIKKTNGQEYGTFVSSNETVIANTISLYPNPCNGSFNIDMPLEIDRFTLSIINNNGSILQNMEYYNEGSNLIDISNLSAGFYTIRILTDSETFFKRIVVY